jgi:nitrite reductase/ring-hydroxylating ferredoxin subunit
MSENTPRSRAPRSPGRRGFLLWASAAGAALAGALLALPLGGYLLAPALRRRSWSAWVSLGKVDDFVPGRTSLGRYRNPFSAPWDGDTAEIPCWVRRLDAERFQIFSIHCTHLGCPVRWFAESGLFLCPCHGGVFYEDGRRAAGPPPRDLYQYRHRVRNGELWIKGGHIPTLSEPV